MLLVEAYIAEMKMGMLFTLREKVTCWSSISITLGKISVEQMHQRLGKRFNLSLKEKIFKPNL
jgi:hypothetical protein